MKILSHTTLQIWSLLCDLLYGNFYKRACLFYIGNLFSKTSFTKQSFHDWFGIHKWSEQFIFIVKMMINFILFLLKQPNCLIPALFSPLVHTHTHSHTIQVPIQQTWGINPQLNLLTRRCLTTRPSSGLTSQHWFRMVSALVLIPFCLVYMVCFDTFGP